MSVAIANVHVVATPLHQQVYCQTHARGAIYCSAAVALHVVFVVYFLIRVFLTGCAQPLQATKMSATSWADNDA